MKIVVSHTEYDGSGGIHVNLHFQDMGDRKARAISELFKDAQESSEDGVISRGEILSLAMGLMAALR